jgi:hypothetical protein
MSFPSSPSNGQTAVINGITYQWSSTYSSWTRIPGQVTATNSLAIINTTPATSTTTGALVVAGGAGFGCSVYIANAGYIAGAEIVTTATLGTISGSAGPSGPSGPSGVSGPSGAAGVSGPSGPSGAAGSNGASGPSGPSGVSGPSGASGVSGPSGPSGAAGSNGASGPSGPSGVSGPSGASGVSGPSGPSGSFTGTTTSTVFINNPTISTTTSTGALTVTGGVGIGGSLYVGGSITASTLTVQTLIVDYTTVTQTLVTSPDIFTITNTTAAISTTTGALTVAGGVGIGGSLYAGQTSYVAGSQIITAATIGNYAAAVNTATSSTSVSFSILDHTASTSTTTGALIVGGGVGVGGAVNIGQTSTVAGAVIITTATIGCYAAAVANTATYAGYSSTSSAVSVVPAIGVNSYYVTFVSTTSGVLSVVSDAGGRVTYNPGYGQLSIASGPQSTSTTTGALVVSGGIGVSGNINVGGAVNVGGVQTTIITTSTTGGSIFFNKPNNQYLSATVPTIGTNDFTIEYWMFNGSGNAIFNGAGSAGSTWGIFVQGQGGYWQISVGNGSGWAVNSVNFQPLAATVGVWTHHAFVRASGLFQVYVNGNSVYSSSISGTSIANQYMQIGAQTRNGLYFNGYLTNFRFVNGTAVYTNNFTPPNQPLTAITNTSLLLDVSTSGSYLTDTSGNSVSVSQTNGVNYSSVTPFVPVTSVTTIPGGIASTSTATGSLIVTGGAGIGGSVNIGQTSTVAGAVIITTATIGNYTAAVNTATSSTSVSFSILDHTASTSTTTGALIVAGGAGIGGNVNVGGVVTATNLFVGPWPVSTSSSSALNIQYNGSSLGSVTTINFATGTTATLVGSVLTVQSTGLRSYSTSTPPTSPNIGDIWYNTATDDMLRYTTDGVNFFWLDINGPYGSGGGGSGSTSNLTSPIAISSSTLAATATAGLLEYNGIAQYFTPTAGQRGVVPGMQFYRLDSAYVGSNVSTAQPFFGVGVTLSSNTVYQFEMMMILYKTTGTTAHTMSSLFGGTAIINNINYAIDNTSSSNTTLPTNITLSRLYSQVATATAFTGNGLNSDPVTVTLTIKGSVSVGTGGTFIPQYICSVAPGGTWSTVAGSYALIYPIGAAGANVSVGTWS